MKDAILKQFRKSVKPLLNIQGIGRFPFVKTLYGLVIELFNPITINGSKMYISRKDGLGLLITPEHEQFEKNLIETAIKPGDSIMDLGAHIGYYTMIMAKKAGKEGRVYAFEPDPNNFKLLEKNIKANNYTNTTAIRKAVSDMAGVTKLYLRGDGVSRRLWDNEGNDYVEIEMTDLDSVFKDKEFNFIKMDVEGCEGRAIKGMINILKRSKPISLVMEFRPADIKEMGSDPLEALKILSDLGFKICNIEGGELKEVHDLKTICDDSVKTNLYCIKR